MLENVIVLRKYTLKYLGGKKYAVSEMIFWSGGEVVANGVKCKQLANLDTKYVDFLVIFLQHFYKFEITSK